MTMFLFLMSKEATLTSTLVAFYCKNKKKLLMLQIKVLVFSFERTLLLILNKIPHSHAGCEGVHVCIDFLFHRHLGDGVSVADHQETVLVLEKLDGEVGELVFEHLTATDHGVTTLGITLTREQVVPPCCGCRALTLAADIYLQDRAGVDMVDEAVLERVERRAPRDVEAALPQRLALVGIRFICHLDLTAAILLSGCVLQQDGVVAFCQVGRDGDRQVAVSSTDDGSLFVTDEHFGHLVEVGASVDRGLCARRHPQIFSLCAEHGVAVGGRDHHACRARGGEPLCRGGHNLQFMVAGEQWLVDGVALVDELSAELLVLYKV